MMDIQLVFKSYFITFFLMGIYLGVDIGSVSVDIAILDEKRIIEEKYIRTRGQPVQTAAMALKEIFSKYGKIENIGATGSGGKLVSRLTNALFVNEVLAQAKGTHFLNPNVKTIIEIGGEDSKLVQLENDGTIKDFSMNTICAAGTGSFLDQQATRLKVNIENEFGELALKSKTPPRIAGRCSVFAKSDMIHLQQEGAPDYDIVAGLCYALARSFVSNIVKGRKLEKPMAFHGGVAKNNGMIRAVKDVFELKEDELFIPSEPGCVGAVGAALAVMEKQTKTAENPVEEIEKYISSHKKENGSLEPLTISEALDLSVKYKRPDFKQDEKVDCYIGVDVGSLSTNVVAIDKNKKLLARIYIRTSGRPIEAVKTGIKMVWEDIGQHLNVKGAATTGSGRYLTGKLIGADVIKNEITAQAAGTLSIDPTVDTIFEIGGQDSKYISLNNGHVVDFEMNKVCAAGTGSFLEEQSEKLDINIVEEFGNEALKAQCPCPLGERCTVFMESDLNAQKQNGSAKDDLVAGLSYSIVYNYLNRVVGDKPTGDNIYFQGAVAFNKGVVSAFRKVTGKDVKVTPNNDVTGAIGAAILVLERNPEKTTFRGFKEIIGINYNQEAFECKSCSNRCDIKKVTFGNEQPVFYGSRCEKYDVDRKDKDNKIPDLFEERLVLLLKPWKEIKDGQTIGIPLCLNFYEWYPFWNAFFSELGYKVIHSDITNNKIISGGISNVSAEQCFPLKVAHGHVLDLVEKKVDYIFLPSQINSKHTQKELVNSFNCPYTQTMPNVIDSALGEKLDGINVLRPIVHFQFGNNFFERELLNFGKELGKEKEEIKKAIASAEKAQGEFYNALQTRGKEVLGNLGGKEKAMVIIARPYNGCDRGVNLDLPKKLRNMGVLAIPLDFLPVDSVDLSKDFKYMYWKYGQKFLGAAELIKNDKRLFAIYLSNFGCGPDSFITRFFKRKIGDKPFLILEVDEHSADAGAITRCEAFLDSIESNKEIRIKEYLLRDFTELSELSRERTIWIPYMGDGSYGLKAAWSACGYKAEVIPLADEEALKIGRKYTNGRECFPMIVTTGDMVKMAQSPDFDRTKAAFFMGNTSGPCRFGQYAKMQRIILDELGYNDVPIVTLTSDDAYGGMGAKFLILSWNFIVAVDILGKALRKTRPYEINKGETDKVYNSLLKEISEAKSIREIKCLLKKAKKCFEAIKVDRSEKKPLIGVIGEIYVRNHHFANNEVIRKIERFGGEAWLAPLAEWFFYINILNQFKNMQLKKYPLVLKAKIEEKYQVMQEHKLYKIFDGFLEGYEEPHTTEVIQNAKPYLDITFHGEAILSMGKSVDFARKGVSGIVNAIPFNCMPGTISNALMKKFRKLNDNIPVLTMYYDGMNQEQNEETRLEAFMHQARQFMVRKEDVLAIQSPF